MPWPRTWPRSSDWVTQLRVAQVEQPESGNSDEHRGSQGDDRIAQVAERHAVAAAGSLDQRDRLNEEVREQSEDRGQLDQAADREGDTRESRPTRQPQPGTDQDRRDGHHVEDADPAMDERQVVEQRMNTARTPSQRERPVVRTMR